MKSGGVERRLTARPDSVDFRDLMYVPTLVEVPPEKPLANYQALTIPVLDQGSEGAYTGFGLATLANFLLATRKCQPDSESVSPHMTYSLARRYDEWAGEDYEGSSCRGAMQGWNKHGICTKKALDEIKCGQQGPHTERERRCSQTTAGFLLPG